MCLAIPYKVISAKERITVATGKEEKEARGSLIKVKAGDMVLMQGNVIIKKISQEEAGEIEKLISSQKGGKNE